MQKVFVMVGLPGSGKSTWSKNYIKKHPNTLIISRDDIRYNLHGGDYIFDNAIEPQVCEITDDMIRILLRTGYDLIIDETNGTLIRRMRLISIIDEYRMFNQKLKIKIIAVIFKHKNNLKNRMKESRGYPEEKWKEIIDNMKTKWKRVSKKEKFDQIINV